MKKIAVLTSGGDAPGMNAAIRAVVRTGNDRGWEVYGVHHGYAGLISDDLVLLGNRDVSGVLQCGGTMLGSARSKEFRTPAGISQARSNLEHRGIEALVVIGGNGSQTGANALFQTGFPVVGVASTIDNDLCGSEITIGVDTATNVALEAIDRLKVTAESHHRAFLVEVMGRNCGYLALMVGIAGGAEAIMIPEQEITPECLATQLHEAYERGKTHAIVVVAEGASMNATQLAQHFEAQQLGFELRATILGHVMRGAAPNAFDRILATRLGAAATDMLADGQVGVLVGMQAGQPVTTPFAEVVTGHKPLDPALWKLAPVLAR